MRVEYTLTPLGWQLTEPLMALYEWAVAHQSELAGLRPDARDPHLPVGHPTLRLASPPAPAPAA